MDLFPEFLSQLLHTGVSDSIVQTRHARTAETDRLDATWAGGLAEDVPSWAFRISSSSIILAQQAARSQDHFLPDLVGREVMQVRGVQARCLDAGEAAGQTGVVEAEKALDGLLEGGLPDLARGDDSESLRFGLAPAGIGAKRIRVLVQQRQTGEDAGLEDSGHVFPGAGAGGAFGGGAGESGARVLQLADQRMLAVAGDEEGVVVGDEGEEVRKAEFGGLRRVRGRVDRCHC